MLSRILANRGLVGAALFTAMLAVAPAALAEGPSVEITDAWVRAAPPGATMLAGYLTLRNTGDTTVRVIGAESPQFDVIEMHESMVADGVAHMHEVDGITIPPGGTVRLEPGGLHLMLIAPTQDFAVGHKAILTIAFDDGWSIEFDAIVSREAP